MTQLRFTDSPRWRETQAAVAYTAGRRRAVLVALQPAALLLRLKGTRQVLTLPFGNAYLRAAILAADESRAAKREARKRKRGAACR